jgi:hypothetical protein
MLSSALHAYLHTCNVLYGTGRKPYDEVRKKLFRKGWVRGYNIIFTRVRGVRFSNGPVATSASRSSTWGAFTTTCEADASTTYPTARRPGSIALSTSRLRMPATGRLFSSSRRAVVQEPRALSRYRLHVLWSLDNGPRYRITEDVTEDL